MTRPGGNAPWAPITTGKPGGEGNWSLVEVTRPYCEACGSYAVRGTLRPGRPSVLLACSDCGARTLARVNWTVDFLSGEEHARSYLQRPRPARGANAARADAPEGR